MKNRNYGILSNFSLLYVEDDKELLKHLNDVLGDFMQKIYAVHSINQAYTVLENEKVDVIITDILLKDESGIDFLKSIKTSQYNEIPTILITAHTDTSYLLEAIKLKVENYLVKPIKLKELLDTLHDIILPLYQYKETKKTQNLIKIISHIYDGKQVDVIKYLIERINEKDEIHTSYTEIASEINISKPTLVKIFKKLSEKGILTNVSHKVYKFNQSVLDNL